MLDNTIMIISQLCSMYLCLQGKKTECAEMLIVVFCVFWDYQSISFLHYIFPNAPLRTCFAFMMRKTYLEIHSDFFLELPDSCFFVCQLEKHNLCYSGGQGRRDREKPRLLLGRSKLRKQLSPGLRTTRLSAPPSLVPYSKHTFLMTFNSEISFNADHYKGKK